MLNFVLPFVLIWVASAILSFGMTNAFFWNYYEVLQSKERATEIFWFALKFSLMTLPFGIFALAFVYFESYRAEYGFKWGWKE